MPLDLKGWRRNWTLMSFFFKGEEIADITKKLKNLKIKHIGFCSFENRFAKSGGLTSVITNILPYMQETNDISSVFLLTPYYPGIINKKKLRPTGISFNVLYRNRNIQVELFKYTWKYQTPATNRLYEYYLKADGFFDSGNRLNDPYVYAEGNEEKNAAMLSENAMFFSKAVPYALKALNITKDTILHLHEWQTSLVSLTVKEAMLNKTIDSCGTAQTIHNSFDTNISWENLARIVDRKRKPLLAEFPGDGLTAYQIGLQLTDAPVTTVSTNFAKEATSDALQTEHFAPHLQNIFRTSGIYGVNNGMFVGYSDKFPKREDHSLKEIRDIKSKNRRSLLQFLSRYKPAERFGELTYQGRSITRLPDNIPIIVMSGRLDTVQKGYDILLRAIERFTEDEIKVIMTPMPVNMDDLDYFYETACKCRGNLTVFPIKMQRGYSALQTGATFGIMPSLYEPFGAAVEYMASGTVNIGRATGGLLDQIDSSCGFIFKEDTVFYTLENIENFISSGRIMQMRKTNPLAQNMADNLYEIIKKAANTYRNNPDKYYKMIINGFKKASHFNWEDNVRNYYQVYSKIMDS